MSKLRSRIFKFFIYFTYPLIILGVIALGALLFLENRKYNQLQDTYNSARESLNKDNQSKQITIDDLKSEFQELSAKVTTLTKENESLKAELGNPSFEGQGTITGKIFPFITADNENFIQYQRVCAESVTNTSIQICRTVSTIQQSYSLIVPQGTYQVYAELFPAPKPNSPYAGKKAYYTEFIACVQQEAEDKCDAKKNSAVKVEVKTGQTISNIDPISWN